MTSIFTTSQGVRSSASISRCGTYRHLLTRTWSDTGMGALGFVMLNPSTADAHVDDPTIRRCVGFAKKWKYDGIAVANLYALRATDPKQLWLHEDPVGPDNDQHLRAFVHANGPNIICAWGASARQNRVVQVCSILTGAGARLWHLGVTKAGAPRHPLYLPADAEAQRWTP